jgi:hypothetical protein
MPWGDCTGPWWMGSRDRAGYGRPCLRRAYGYGRGFGCGRGFGLASETFARPTPEEERSYLEAVARDLERDLNSIRERIDKLRPTP